MADDRFIVLENKTTTGKTGFVIYRKPDGSTSYSELIARCYSAEWANKLVFILNNMGEIR